MAEVVSNQARPAFAVIEEAFARAAGTPLVPGNEVRLLRDAGENYPAWLEAIAGARRTVHFESYIIHDDEAGQEFARALKAKAAEGVRVRVIYDWLGAVGKTSRRFWRDLREGGIEVRCFNPPGLSSPFAWVSRDHRKMLAVDGRVAFVTGLCVGHAWVGDPARGIEPWRDTGIAVRGPAVADLEWAFARMWALAGAPIADAELPARESLPPAGDVAVRVIAGMPGTAELYRLDQLIAAAARQTLWLTDAYFVGTTAYVQSLRAAARDGVDVRLLVPGASDIWVLRGLSRAGYRPLLEGGVRVYEWNGPMLHAKTAVADGRWARVGSTNLNLQSWIGNWELDVAVEDEGFAGRMEDMYLDDLGRATEITLTRRARVVRTAEVPRLPARRPGSAGRAAAGAVSIGSAVGAAMTGRRVLGPAEARIMGAAGVALLVLGLVALLWPWAVAVPLAVLAIWLAGSLLFRAWVLRRERAEEKDTEG
ncbi:MAG TPA: phospholipase D-like domain-containing protein [Candidatus Deferrimicrobiaceae bacterium]|nr:phospholipase D-like domain-containing protein [Candidatus Deferrimicrobiaceae bacterium]